MYFYQAVVACRFCVILHHMRLEVSQCAKASTRSNLLKVVFLVAARLVFQTKIETAFFPKEKFCLGFSIRTKPSTLKSCVRGAYVPQSTTYL